MTRMRFGRCDVRFEARSADPRVNTKWRQAKDIPHPAEELRASLIAVHRHALMNPTTETLLWGDLYT
jgi:hypothetical protein